MYTLTQCTSHYMSELPVSEAFIIALLGGLTGVLGMSLTCCLKSRCSHIKMCCIECDREVIPVTELNSVIVRPTSAV